jgi:NADH-quinone oxidoreductase subunit K
VITLSHYLVLGAILFAISVVGIFLNRRNVIVLLMAIELMLLAVRSRPRYRPSGSPFWSCCSAS